MKSIRELKDLDGKNVLLRVDFDVPIVNGYIVEPFRIRKEKETIDYLMKGGAKLVAVAHINAISSFKPIVNQLESLLGVSVKFVQDI